MKKVFIILLFPIFAFSQTIQEKNEIISNTNTTALRSISEKNDIQFKENKRKAQELAKLKNWPLITFKDSIYSELVGVSLDLKPIYYSTYNEGAGITSRANKLYSGGSLGLNINGENMTAAVWDAGSGMPTHQLFTGRLQLIDNSPSTHYHSCHVAGTIIGSELFQNGNARGMAYKGNVNSYDWNSDVAEVAAAASNGLLISNHSYGRNPSGLQIYEWGKYDTTAQSLDEIMYNAPFYQFVCAAGNSRTYGVNTGKNGYDLLSTHATSKNGITVAAVYELPNYTGPSSVIMSAFSSWGSTDDGRIKPDISAKGVDTFSSIDSSTSSYDVLSGTSMASPSVAGTLLLYQQYYKQLNNSFMKASTLKGLMIHTADEAGDTPGPDYKFGWGLINAEKAADVISKKDVQSFILENTLIQNGTFSIAVNALGTEPLMATLCWTDPKGNIPSSANDDPTPNLINDLDLRITQNSTPYFPWKLNGANVANPATQADNNVDNVEKIELNNPTGNYLITISHKGNLLNNLQNYSLVISGISSRDFWVTTTENRKAVCDGVTSLAYDFTLHKSVNFNGIVAFSTLNLPNGIAATFTPETMNLGGDFSMNLTNLSSLLSGTYTFIVVATSGTDSYQIEITLTILSPNILISELTQPANNANSISLLPSLNWSLDPNAESYDIQIASDINFNNILQQANVSQNSFSPSLLINNTTYFWRVRAKNTCNVGTYSAPFQFTTVCVMPSNILQVAATTNSASISWTENSGATSWEIEVVPQNTTPSGVGQSITTNPYTVSGLSTNTCYDFYVRSFCGVGYSSWTSKVTFCTQPDYCGGDHFYDTGGANGTYQDGENYTKVIYPENAGDRVRAVFNYFSTEGGFDYLRIYNGPNTDSPLLFSGSGSSSPGTKTATNPSGALTFQFYSDGSVVSGGWDATIWCEPLPACPVEPNNFSQLSSSTTAATVSWTDNSAATSWEIEIVPNSATPTGAGTVITSNPYVITGLNTNSCYQIYVRSICADGFSSWSSPFTFCTQPNYCGGDHFYDSGGANGNYQNYENITTVIFPENLGDRVKALFNYIQFETCCDNITVYNGPSTSFPQLFNGNGTILPGILKSTHATGALTFRFQSDGSIVSQGWDATITCEPLPPCPQEPTAFSLQTVSTTSATISWQENSGSTSWEVEIVPQGTPPTGVGVTTTNNPYVISGLTSNTWYDFYVRSNCSLGQSSWAPKFTFNTNANYCAGDHFYDSGGPNANYPNNLYKTTTIYPDANGDRIKAIFNSFQVENFNDYFAIYNGPNSSAPLLYSNSNNIPPGTIVSTHFSGALTFVFSSNSSTNFTGWDASIICEDLPPCPNSPSNININNITTTNATISWTENSQATSWEVEVVPQGTPPIGIGTVVSSNPYVLANLTSNTWYDLYVRSKCNDGNSEWATLKTFNTAAVYCSGDHFYDTNGPNANYPNYEYKTTIIYPDNAGDRVRAIFNYFTIENTSAQLVIYNGTNSSFPKLYDSNIDSTLTEVASTHTSGALCFQFYSNASIFTSAGWDATIICEALPPCANAPTNVTKVSISSSEVTVSWVDNSTAGLWEVKIVPQGAIPEGNGTLTSNNPYTAEGLNSNTNYDVYVRSICGIIHSNWSTFLPIRTQGNYCAGEHFYDTGGASGSYQDGEYYTTTIFPQVPGNFVTVIFNSFQLESCCDALGIYNGPNTSYPQLYYGGSVSPGTKTSTDPSGALTFLFTSDYSVTRSGWDATVSCGSLGTVDNEFMNSLQYYPNPTASVINIKSIDVIKTFAVYDINMRLILSEKVNAAEFEIELSDFSAGAYFVKFINDEDKTKEIKVIKL